MEEKLAIRLSNDQKHHIIHVQLSCPGRERRNKEIPCKQRRRSASSGRCQPRQRRHSGSQAKSEAPATPVCPSSTASAPAYIPGDGSTSHGRWGTRYARTTIYRKRTPSHERRTHKELLLQHRRQQRQPRSQAPATAATVRPRQQRRAANGTPNRLTGRIVKNNCNSG